MFWVHIWWITSSATNSFYGIVSGWLGDLGLLVGLVMYYRKHNCHVKGCPRLGKHSVGDGSLIVCKKHHPLHHDTRITPEHVQFHHMRQEEQRK